jgi:hypothetical protein
VKRIVSNTGPLLHLHEAELLSLLGHAGEIHNHGPLPVGALPKKGCLPKKGGICPKMALSEVMLSRPTRETMASGPQTSWPASPIFSSALQARRRRRGRP